MTDTTTTQSADQPSEPKLPDNIDAALAEMERAESGLPEPSAESAAEPAADDQQPADDQPQADDDSKSDDRPRGDPRVALREERERRRAAEAEVQKSRQNLAQMAAMLQALRQQLPQQQQPAEQEQPPDFNQDPAGYLRHQVETLRNQLSTVNAEIQRRAQLEAAQQQFAEAVSTVSRFESEFAQSNPDYYDAVDYMRERLAKKLEITGTPKDQIPAMVAQQMRTFGLMKLRAGQNPAEQIFALAKLEGYTGPRESTAAKLSTVAQGQSASRGARPSAPATPGKFTPESLASMSYSELAKLDDDAWRKVWEQ